MVVAAGNDMALETQALGMIFCLNQGREPVQVTLNDHAALTPNCKPDLSAPPSS